MRDVSFSIGGKEILKDINLKVKRGDFLGIVGPNGAGKTTLLRIMLGLLKPSRGEVMFFGEPLKKEKVSKRVGYVPQKVHFTAGFPLTVEEAVKASSFGKNFSMERFEYFARLLGVYNLMDRRVHELSGGEFQRVLICGALSREPDVLVLDEPNTGIDSVGQDYFYRVLKNLNDELGLTVVMVSHDIGAISSYVNEVACLNRRLYFHGKPDSEFEKSIKEAYGEGIDLIKHGDRCVEGALERRVVK